MSHRIRTVVAVRDDRGPADGIPHDLGVLTRIIDR